MKLLVVLPSLELEENLQKIGMSNTGVNLIGMHSLVMRQIT
jgi:hypothetical protein